MKLTFTTLLFLTSLVASSQITYYVSLAGNDSWNGLHSEYLGGSDGPWQTIQKANLNLLPEDAVELLAGNYSEQIRPANSGLDDNNRITYRPFGDGPVVLDVCGYSEIYVGEGAIALGERDYITVSGRSATGPSNQRLLQLRITGICGLYANMTGSTGSIIENVDMRHTGTTYAPNRGVAFSDFWYDVNYESSFCILRNCIIQGYVRDASDSQKYTEDLITVSGQAHHILIENNLIGTSLHVSLNANSATVEKLVYRNNRVINPEHTAISFYGLGEIPNVQHRHLVEGNRMRASGNQLNPAGGPGNALQFGASESVVRYNVIRESGATAPTPSSTIAGQSCNSGGFPAQIRQVVDNRTYHNTLVDNGQQAVGSFYFGGDSDDHGRNKWVNNIFYKSNGADQGLVKYWRGYNDGLDRYFGNLFGNPSGDSSQPIIDVGYGLVSLGTAIAGYNNPIDPDFGPFLGYENFYSDDPGFSSLAQGDFSLSKNSICRDAAAPLTQVVSSASWDSSTGVGMKLYVEDARYFYGAASEFPVWMNVMPEWIAVGTDVASAKKVQISRVDADKNTLLLKAPIQSQRGDFVWLWKNSEGNNMLYGTAPDLGAFEATDATAIDNETTAIDETDETTALNEVQEVQLGYTLYPNPTCDFLQVEAQGKHVRAIVINSIGQEVKRTQLSGATKIPVSDLQAGLYLLKLENDEQSVIREFIIHCR